jgi:SIR2-like domain
VIAERRAIIVVGAGASIGASGNAPVASWTGLLEHGVQRCVSLGLAPESWAERQAAALRSGDLGELLAVAQQVESKLGAPHGGEYGRWLGETVGALALRDREVPGILAGLAVPLATTNYDSLLEEASGLRPVTWRDSARVEQALRGDAPGVLHLHGHWEDPASVVLGIRSYEAVLGDAHAQAVLRSLPLLRSLVFVGFGGGLADPNFGALLRWMGDVFARSPYRHFRLARADQVAALQREHPPEQRIRVLSYGAGHDDLAPFLRGLRPPAAPAAARPAVPAGARPARGGRPLAPARVAPGLALAVTDPLGASAAECRGARSRSRACPASTRSREWTRASRHRRARAMEDRLISVMGATGHTGTKLADPGRLA